MVKLVHLFRSLVMPFVMMRLMQFEYEADTYGNPPCMNLPAVCVPLQCIPELWANFSRWNYTTRFDCFCLSHTLSGRLCDDWCLKLCLSFLRDSHNSCLTSNYPIDWVFLNIGAYCVCVCVKERERENILSSWCASAADALFLLLQLLLIVLILPPPFPLLLLIWLLLLIFSPQPYTSYSNVYL